MNKSIKAFALVASFGLVGAAPVLADTAAATPAAPTVKVDGMVDAYYSYNFSSANNHNNVGYFYNGISNSYSLGLAEAKLTATQGAATGVLQLAYNDANTNLPIGAGTGDIGVLQAYAQYVTGDWTLKGGRFVTWMGNEVIEGPSNWNYSHSILFQYTIPVLHQGIGVGYALGSDLSVTGYATNGWNNSVNTAKFTAQTFGASLAWTPNSMWKIVLNGIDGPGVTALNINNLQYDFAVGEAIIGYTPNSDWAFALDFEYGGQDLGQKENVNVGGSSTSSTLTSATFWGADLYGKYAIASDLTGALRLEWVSDPLNILNVYRNNNTFGDSVTSHEATLTFTKSVTTAWTVSLEGRYDWESAQTGGTAKDAFASDSKPNQATATLSTAFVF